MMEQPPKEEQKQAPQPLETNIPLDSPLEISRENTVVPVASPSFLRKPMSPYSGVLANSVKFEDEGWFYDWKRFFMNYETGIRPEGIIRLDKYDNDVYYLELDSGKSCFVSFATSIATREGDVLKCSVTFNDAVYELVIDANTLELITDVPSTLRVTVDNKVETNREVVKIFITAINPVDPVTQQWINRFWVRPASFSIVDNKGESFPWFEDSEYYKETVDHWEFGKDPVKPSLILDKSTRDIGPSEQYKRYPGEDVCGISQPQSGYMEFDLSLVKMVVAVTFISPFTYAPPLPPAYDPMKWAEVSADGTAALIMLSIKVDDIDPTTGDPVEVFKDQIVLIRYDTLAQGVERTYFYNNNAYADDVYNAVMNTTDFPEWQGTPTDDLLSRIPGVVIEVSPITTGLPSMFSILIKTPRNSGVEEVDIDVHVNERVEVVPSTLRLSTPLSTLLGYTSVAEIVPNNDWWLFKLDFLPLKNVITLKISKQVNLAYVFTYDLIEDLFNNHFLFEFEDIELIGDTDASNTFEWGERQDSVRNVHVKLRQKYRVWTYGFLIDARPVSLDDRHGVYSAAEIVAMIDGVMYINAPGTEGFMIEQEESGGYRMLTPGWALDSQGDVLSPYKSDNKVVEINAIGTFYPSSPLVYGGISSTSYSWIVTIDGIDYHINKEYTSAYRWYSEDIRTRTTSLLRTYQPQEAEYTVCESYWATSKDKYVWVINDTTCIVIHYNDRISMLKKTGKKDIFKTYEWKESAFRQLSDYKFYRSYGISCAIDAVPYIWELDYDTSALLIRYRQAPTDNLNTLGTAYTVRVPVNQSVMSAPCGNPHSNSQINQLAPYYTTEELWNICKVSATRVGNQLWLALSCDKALKQWTIKCNGNSIAGIVYGFGFVGIDGTLTGGIYPTTKVTVAQGLNLSSGLKTAIQAGAPKGVPNENGTVSINNDMANGSSLYVNGCIYFTEAFTSMVVAIEKGTKLVTVPAYQSYKELCQLGQGTSIVSKTPLNSDNEIVINEQEDLQDLLDSWRGRSTVFPPYLKMIAHDPPIWNGVRCAEGTAMNTVRLYLTGTKAVLHGSDACLFRIGTSAGAMCEIAASSWKSMNDVQKSEPERVLYAQQNFRISHFNERMIAALAVVPARGISGANFQSAIPDILSAGAVGEEKIEEQDSASNLGDRLASDTGVQRVSIRLSDFYSVGQGSHYYAAPGLIQGQLIKQAALNAASSFVTKCELDGKGKLKIDETYSEHHDSVIAPLIVWFFLGGHHSNWSETITDDPVEFSTGQYQSSFARAIGYRKYGYAHRYINYPIENIKNHVLKDFTVSIDRVGQKTVGETSILTMVAPLNESKATEVTTTFNDYVSVVEGANLDHTALSSAKKSYKGSGAPQFSAPYIYDYCVYRPNKIFYSAIDGEIVYVSIKDTKVLDGPPCNIVVQGSKTLIGSPYCALEVLPPSYYSLDLLRPRAVTPQSILLNTTGINCVHGDRIYHACDAYSNRITAGQGAVGNDIEQQNSVYTFRADDDFKISSIFPPASYMGKFSSPFSISYPHHIEHHTPYYRSLLALSETYQIPRYSIPVISKRLALLPAVVKTLAAYKLNVTDGVTSLCTELRSTTERARRPDSLDFGIYGQLYRWNSEYISEIVNQMGVQDIRDLVATLGLDYIGSTPDVAWFYSRAVRAMYNFSPKTIKRLMNVDRFKNVTEGAYDFVEQETVLEADTELGKVIARVGSKGFIGDIPPPNETIGPYEFYSMAGGLVFQGNRRFQVNRFLIMDEMVADIKRNAARYDKIIGHSVADFWSSRRNYRWAFDFNPAPSTAVKGWYIEPHIWATSYLGIDDYSECKFEWLINFTISDIMLNILEDKYVTVYFASETMTTGGVKQSDVSTLQLHKNMFVRTGNYGYYQYKYNGANGIGDSERLFVWADGPVAVRSIKQNAINVSKKRLSPMVTSQEVRGKEEW